MRSFILVRALQSVIAIFGVLTVVFFLQRLSGDPVALLLPTNATAEDAERLRAALGLDRPLLEQYGSFLSGLLHLDLGRSIVQRVPVVDIIASRLPYTLTLAAAAFCIAFGLGIVLGVVAAVWRGRLSGRIPDMLVLASQSMPTFWSGMLMILVFSVGLRWLPASGSGSAISLLMPAAALGIYSMASFARVTRAAFLDELPKEYVRTARAKGLRLSTVVIRHIARNASIPIITVSALELSNLLGGAVIVETVFAWPGLGQLTMQSIASRDFVVVQGVVLLGATTAIGLNFLADVLYSLADPRIRIGRHAG